MIAKFIRFYNRIHRRNFHRHTTKGPQFTPVLLENRS